MKLWPLALDHLRLFTLFLKMSEGMSALWIKINNELHSCSVLRKAANNRIYVSFHSYAVYITFDNSTNKLKTVHWRRSQRSHLRWFAVWRYCRSTTGNYIHTVEDLFPRLLTITRQDGDTRYNIVLPKVHKALCKYNDWLHYVRNRLRYGP